MIFYSPDHILIAAEVLLSFVTLSAP